MSGQIASPTSEVSEPVPAGCMGCEARTRGICGSLHGEQLSELSRMSHRRSVAAGNRIGRGVSNADTFGVILSGVVSLSKNLPDGRHQIVALQFAPSFVGRPFRETEDIEACASSQVRICTFPRSSFETMLGHNSPLERRVLSETLSQLDETRDWLIVLGRKTALERVATYLELISSHARPGPNGTVPLDVPMPLTRGEMSDFLGLTIETVSRKMTELRKMGIIEFQSAAAIRICSSTDLHLASGNSPQSNSLRSSAS